MFHIEFTTTVPCINNCRFCPQDILRQTHKRHERMTLENFKLMLASVPKDVRIDFSGFSEPFGSRDAANMMRHAYDSGYRVCLFTSLVGLMDEDIAKMKGMRFSDLHVHAPDDWNFTVPDAYAWYKAYSRFRMFFHVDSMMHHFGNVIPDILTDSTTTVWTHSSVHTMSPRCNNVNPEVIPHLSRIPGNIANRVPAECREPGFVVLPNGECYVCCMDFGLKHFMGNLLTRSLKDLTSGDLFQGFLQARIDDRINDCICRYCERVGPR